MIPLPPRGLPGTQTCNLYIGPFESVQPFFLYDWPQRKGAGSSCLFSFSFFLLESIARENGERHVNYDHGSGSPRPTMLPVIIPLPSCALATVSCKPAPSPPPSPPFMIEMFPTNRGFFFFQSIVLESLIYLFIPGIVKTEKLS